MPPAIYTFPHCYCINQITAYNVFITKREVSLIPYKEKTHMRVTATTYFIVRDRITGGEYLTIRKSRSNANQPAYRWTKEGRFRSFRFATYDAVQKAAQRYGGEIVRCTKVAVVSTRGYQKTTLREVL